MIDEIVDIAFRSLWISSASTLLALMWSLPIAIFLGIYRFRGRRFLISFFNAMLGIPTVALGLVLYLLLSKKGPFGVLDILYTPNAIILGQSILITPIVVSLLANSLEAVDPEVRDLAKTLGASEREASLAILGEARKGVVLAVIAAFNRAISELGIALMLGGNIRGWTRVMTTAISLETAKGNVEISICLATILLAIVFGLTFLVNLLRED